jgi:hypothetical protein
VPERETADSMVPEDFWAILTGQPARAPPEPWGALEDISSGEIADGRGRVQSAAAVGPDAAPVRRGVGRGTYTRLLETGDIRDLRKAIVIREVLGTPVGFREEEADRGAW